MPWKRLRRTGKATEDKTHESPARDGVRVERGTEPRPVSEAERPILPALCALVFLYEAVHEEQASADAEVEGLI